MKAKYRRAVFAFGLLFWCSAEAAAQSLAGTWACQMRRQNGETYDVTMRISAKSAQWGQRPEAPLTVSGNDASFTSTFQNGTEGTVSMSRTGNTLSVQVRGRATARPKNNPRGYHLGQQEYVHSGTCSRR